MKVELERTTENGQRGVRVVANDTARQPETLRQWIKMLQLAERWLREVKPKQQ
ncbi:hypothetical protein HAP48_0035235 [Bradyrhizobium septentrionale]|uniref:Uncharacterized protein n=1 Tax=Bradyrhizobium septentrionale TaxID=1404411 RepID=A0A974A074_9BRAD|nr:hypothetical protein [Bradyrhizobium septentrionale]UGY13789.1 hypothetical protein HAP48_0035235 [Bradyrhizobium septentrionale]